MSQGQRVRRITILSGNHLCHNPRVWKEAATLAHAGFEVEVLGAWVDPGLKERDQAMMADAPFRYEPVLDMTASRILPRWRNAGRRVVRRLCRDAFSLGGMPSRWLLGHAVGALLRAAKRRDSDLFIAHSEAALFAVAHLAATGCRIGVDMEDWFSEDLMPEARVHRPVEMLRRLERTVLRAAAHSSCPSMAMSRELARAYGGKPPTVIYNAFAWTDRLAIDGAARDRSDRATASIHWVSQTVGPGRGLEDLFAALPRLPRPVQVHLRGTPVAGFDAWLSSQLAPPWRARVHVHPLVDNSELLSRISEHDVGFAGEVRYCASRDLTVTNKLLHCLLAGLPVVASDTAGQLEVARRAPGAVLPYPAGDAVALAANLAELLGNPARLAAARTAALSAAKEIFCWERQAEALVRSVENAFVAEAMAREEVMPS